MMTFGYRQLALSVALMFLVAGFSLPREPDSSDGSPAIGPGWSGNGANLSGVWRPNPATGTFEKDRLGAGPVDPYQYKYEYQCDLDVGEFATPCLGRDLTCTGGPNGEDGIPVVWYRAPAGITDPRWTYHSGPTCFFDPEPEDLLPRIAAEIQREFQNLPISAGTVAAQPSPHTLRGAETNFYAAAVEQQFDITMFGQAIHVVATPVQYTWNYGEGTVFGPQPSMGGPLPQDRWGEKTRTSHAYGETGDYQVVLTTSFQGTYSVNAGPPLPIPGQGQFSAPPQTISVWRSLTRNYADDCNANPQGQGCPGTAR